MKPCRYLWFGFYNPKYSRNRVLLNGLRSLGAEVVECRVDPKAHGRIGKYVRLFRSALALRRERWDAVIVAYPGLNAAWAAWLLFPGRIVYDAFFSVYQSEVEDRGAAKPGSPRATALFVAEWIVLRMARVVLLDTWTHARYFVKTFGLPESRFRRVPIGADDGIFRPTEGAAAAGGEFIVEFHGTFIPLQGIETILEAAKVLEDIHDIRFRIIGGGQTKRRMQELADHLALKNLVFVGPLPQTSENGPSVVSELGAASVVLGIFGTGRKTDLVVPNKVYEGMACAKPVVTADTTAVRELLTCGRHVACVPPGDAEALAKKIRELRTDAALRNALAQEARRSYVSDFSPRPVAESLLNDLESVFGFGIDGRAAEE